MKAVPGRKKCGICLQKDKEAQKRARDRKGSIKEYRKENHLCYFCGDPIDLEKGQICSKCFEKCRDNGAKSNNSNKYWQRDNRIIFKKQ